MHINSLKNFDKTKVKKILCIKPRGIGDILLSTIILDNLISYFGNEIKIDYLTEHFAKTALENDPRINIVISMDKKEFPLKVASKLRSQNYDLLLDLWSNPRSAQITFLSFIKWKVGYAYKGRRYAYNILATNERGDYHSAIHNLKILEALRIPIISKRVQYFTSAEDDKQAEKFFHENFKEPTNVCGIVPSGGWASKRCEKTKWVEIASALINEFKMEFLILWGPGDEEDAEYIKDQLKESVVLAPKTDLNSMASLIKMCRLIIANDSGPMHISAALDRPTLGIFGPTNPIAHGPYSAKADYISKADLFCIVCNKLDCPYNHECMFQIDVGLLISKVKKLL